jgi:hypothetical protein
MLMVLAMVIGVAAADESAAPDEFMISYWWGPPAAETTDARYAEIAEANFNVVLQLIPDIGVAKRTLELCAKYKLKAIVSDPRIAAALDADTLDLADLDAVVAEYNSYASLLGYFIMDEPSAARFPRLGKIVERLRAKDPKRFAFINLFPNYASAGQLGVPTYAEHLSDYITQVRPSLISYDHYALMQDGSIRGGYFENLSQIAASARDNHLPFVDILLLTPHFSYRNPSEADLRWQVYTAVAYGARGILYFTYWTPDDSQGTFHDGVITVDGKRTRHYDEVKRINGELRVLGPTLMRLRWLRTYCIGEQPTAGTERAPSDSLVRDCNAPLLVGEFKNVQDADYILIVNQDLAKEQDAVVRFDESVQAAVEIRKSDGAATAVPLRSSEGGHDLEVKLDPGDARLFRLTVTTPPGGLWQ